MRLLGSVSASPGNPLSQNHGEPGGTPIAEAIRRICWILPAGKMLPETSSLLYNASRCQHTGELIIPALEAGKIVICAVTKNSTYAYQDSPDLDDEILIL